MADFEVFRSRQNDNHYVALLVGVLESFSSFYASAFKEVIVFTLIIPVLLWRSFQHGHDDEEEQ